jgi:hypothetical protein
MIAAGTLGDVQSMLLRLVDFLKSRTITALFTSLTHTETNGSENSELGISSLMDTWLLLRDIELSGERNRGIYVLKSRGHDVHDGGHIPWKAGDVMIVENGCVHQHFNDDPKEEAILLVFKAKPLFLFMHLLFQKIVEWPSKIPPKGAENYKPPSDI